MKILKTLLTLLILSLISNYSFTQITSFPHSTNFSSNFGDWLQSGTDNFDWTQKTSGTNSSGTGPQASPYGANGTTGYVYTETSSPISTNQTARLFCTYDLSNKTSASVVFYYHIYAASGHGPGTLRLKIYKGNSGSGGTWSYPWTVTTSHNGWQQTTVDLADYIGYSYVQLAFESITPASGAVWQCDNAIDEVVVTATGISTWNGSGGDDNWNTASNWSTNAVPTSGTSCVIPAGVPCNISNGGSCNNLTINSGADFTIISGTVNVTGNLDASSGILNVLDGKLDITGTAGIGTATIGDNGEIEVGGTTTLGSNRVLTIGGIFDANGNFDATVDPPTFPNADINFGVNGRLTLAGGINYLGDLSTSDGTVEYDGGTQTVISDTYNNLSISVAGTKTAGGNLTVNGDLTTAATSTCKLDMGSSDLISKGAITIGSTDGLDLSDVNCDVTLSGSSSQLITHSGSTVSTIESNTTDYSIPDQSYVESTIAISSSANASDLTSITLNITHTYTADLDITLYAPNGSSINLSSDNGSGGNNYTNTVFTSGVGTAITSGSAPFTGNYTPEVAFSNLTGTANGNWKLRITDDYSGDIGDLLDWEINISGTASGGLFKDIVINNSSGISLSSNLEIVGTLTLTNGDINTNTNTITVTTDGTISGGSSSSMVLGNLAIKTNSTSSKTFPVGDGTNYRPVIITPSSSSSETYTVKYYNAAHANTTMGSGLHHVSQYYWDINRANSVNAELAFDWDQGYAVDAPVDLKLAHYNSGTSEWEDMSATISGAGGSGSASNSSGRLTATATSFSPFGFGSGSEGNALPIDLISFEGEVLLEMEPIVLLEWVVASQVNNDYFTIERSRDMQEWETLETITGLGNSNIQMSYSLIDDNALRGVSYYRLSQTDFDGEIKTFHPIAITVKEERKEIVKRTNLMGQTVNSSYQGIIIEIWDNGDIEKIYQNR
tara:strand:- start:263 stop:3121 length:2859 start_codon:yes stop_codon:yes gene_type:complete